NNLAAAQARLTSLADSYPLYSGVDDALYLLGGVYEREAASMRQQKQVPEVLRAKLAGEYDHRAIETYSRIITRYPAMDRAEDARKRLTALKADIPTPTQEAMAESKAEEDSRGSTGKFHTVLNNFRKHPDVNKTAQVGEPNLQEEEIISAPAEVQHLDAEIRAAAVTMGTGPAPGANQPPPSSNSTGNGSAPAASTTNDQTGQQGTSTNTATPPARTNEIGVNSDGSNQNSAQSTQDGQQKTSDQLDSSSKKKKKKGLKKIIPF